MASSQRPLSPRAPVKWVGYGLMDVPLMRRSFAHSSQQTCRNQRRCPQLTDACIVSTLEPHEKECGLGCGGRSICEGRGRLPKEAATHRQDGLQGPWSQGAQARPISTTPVRKSWQSMVAWPAGSLTTAVSTFAGQLPMACMPYN